MKEQEYNPNEPTDILTQWVLLVDVDFFGRTIHAGTIFKQVT